MVVSDVADKQPTYQLFPQNCSYYRKNSQPYKCSGGTVCSKLLQFLNGRNAYSTGLLTTVDGIKKNQVKTAMKDAKKNYFFLSGT